MNVFNKFKENNNEGSRIETVDENGETISLNPPVPILIKIFGIIILVMFIISSYNIPEQFNAKLNYEKGKALERKMEYAKAIDCYKKVSKTFPNSTALLTRIFISTYNLNNLSETLSALEVLLKNEQDLSYSDKIELNPVLEKLNLVDKSNEKVETK